MGELGSVQRMWLKNWKKALVMTLAGFMTINSVLIGLAQAEMIATEQVIENTDLSDDRARIESFLSREDVQEQLIQLGVDPQEAAKRVASLTNEEVRQIAGRLDELPAGEGAVGAIVGAVVLIFLVLLITDLLGLTDVFPFVKKRAN